MINYRKVLAITLARGGSKSIPNKNIVDINGKPLIQYTTDEVKKSKYIDSYCVSTDSLLIKEVCNSLNVKVIDRPIDLATDNAKSSDALIHAVQSIPDFYHYIVEVMVTNPLKTAEDIDGCIEMIENQLVYSVVSVVRIWDHHPARVKYLEDNIMRDFYPEVLESRRQDLSPPAYVRNGSIYVMTRDFLLTYGVRYNKGSMAYIMPEERSINIDQPIDLIVAKALLEGLK